METLLRHSADVNARDKNWQTPLHIAAANNAVRCSEFLTPLLTNVNVSDRAGRTSLHHACFNGHKEVNHSRIGLIALGDRTLHGRVVNAPKSLASHRSGPGLTREPLISHENAVQLALDGHWFNPHIPGQGVFFHT